MISGVSEPWPTHTMSQEALIEEHKRTLTDAGGPAAGKLRAVFARRPRCMVQGTNSAAHHGSL
ncbi:MAG TPA: hypothetical protein VF532_10735 [Candidatus Angelobacter sp.]